MHWESLTTVEIGGISRRTPVLLLLAATEQHGPHLPLATDRLIADHFAAEAHRALPDKVLVLPTLGIGCSAHHLGFPGTLSVGHETFRRTALDVLDSAYHHGFRNFMLLNAHGGNQSIGGVIQEQFGFFHPDCRIAFASWWQIAREALAPLNATGPGGAGHACEFETSLMLHFAPEQVRTELVPAKANLPTFPWAEGDMLRSPSASLYRGMKEMTPHGAFGEPRAANAELGASISHSVTAALTAILNDLNS